MTCGRVPSYMYLNITRGHAWPRPLFQTAVPTHRAKIVGTVNSSNKERNRKTATCIAFPYDSPSAIVFAAACPPMQNYAIPTSMPIQICDRRRTHKHLGFISPFSHLHSLRHSSSAPASQHRQNRGIGPTRCPVGRITLPRRSG